MATLLEIRTRLVDESGRFDLVTDAEGGDYSDTGGNQAINDAIEWLREIRIDLEDLLGVNNFVLLVNDGDTNYWSVTKPHILVSAARRILEVRHRNTSGVKDWEAIIIPDVSRIQANERKADIDADVAIDQVNRTMAG